MTIDEAIEKFKFIAKSDTPCPRYCMLPCDQCVDESEHIAEWLEELKCYRDKNKMVVRVDVENMDSIKDKIDELLKYAEHQYNKAIDDFVELAKEHYFNHGDKDITECVIGIVEFFAEQLKEGASNENNS